MIKFTTKSCKSNSLIVDDIFSFKNKILIKKNYLNKFIDKLINILKNLEQENYVYNFNS